MRYFIEDGCGGAITAICLREKPSDKFKIIINLKPLNRRVKYRWFRMESVYSLQSFLPPDCFLCSLNIKDVYQHIPIYLIYQPLLRLVV